MIFFRVFLDEFKLYSFGMFFLFRRDYLFKDVWEIIYIFVRFVLGEKKYFRVVFNV